MSLVENFSGGISRAMSKFVTRQNCSVLSVNGLIEFGYLENVSGTTKVATCDKYFYVFMDQLFSFKDNTYFVEINQTVFYKQEDKPLKAIYRKFNIDEDTLEETMELVDIDAGIVKESAAIFNLKEVDIPEIDIVVSPSIRLNFEGMTAGTYKYKLVYLYLSGVVYTQEISIAIEGKNNAVSFKHKAQNQYTAHLYREQDGKYYLVQRIFLDIDGWFQDADNNLLGNVIMPIGIEGKILKLRYQYTYWNETFQIESQHTTLSEIFEVDPKKAYSLLDIFPSKIEKVTHILIYRLGENAIFPTLIGKIKNDVEKDTLEFSDIITNPSNIKILDTTIPKYVCSKEMINLVVYNGLLLGSIKDRLYHSDASYPEYWADKDSFKLDDVCTAMLPYTDGVLAFTKTKTFLIMFSNGLPYQYLITEANGCNSMGSCNSVFGIPIFSNNTGFFMVANNKVSKLSHPLLGNLKDLEVLDSVVYNGMYYASTKDTIYCINFDTGTPVITNIYDKKDIDTMQVYKDGRIYAHSNGSLLTMFTGEKERFHYKTAVLHENDPINKFNYNMLSIIGQGKIKVTVYTNGANAKSFVVDFNSTYMQKTKKLITKNPVRYLNVSTPPTNGVELEFNALDEFSRIDLVYLQGSAHGGT